MISIVLTHYNRTKLLERALNSFKHYYSKYVEVIVVDDGSSNIELERLYELRRKFNFRLISIAAKDKWYSNPCIPFNIGIDHAVGEKCILQSAECIHLGSVIKSVDEQLQPGEFISFACYSLDKVQTKALDSMNFDYRILLLIVIFQAMPLVNYRRCINKAKLKITFRSMNKFIIIVSDSCSESFNKNYSFTPKY